MAALTRWQRDLVCLALGAGAALGGVWLRPSHREGSNKVPVGATPITHTGAGGGTLPTGEGEPDAKELLRQARLNDIHGWKKAYAADQVPGDNRTRALSLMLLLDAKGVGELAARLVQEPDPGKFLDPVGDVFNRWSELDPYAALALARTLKAPYRDRAVNAALDGFSRTQPAQVCAWLAATDRQDPNWLGEAGDRSWRDSKLTDAVREWARQDPAAAAKFYDAMPGSISDYATRDVAAAWAARDPVAAMTWAAHLPQKTRQWSMAGGMGAWAKQDPVSAAGYFEELAGDPVQTWLRLPLIEGWASQDPLAAAAWVLKIHPNSSEEIRLAVSPWMQSDPGAVMAWAVALPSEGSRALTYPSIVQGLIKDDPAKAEQWLGTLPSGESRDNALYSYCFQPAVASNAPALLGWAGQIGQTDRRDEATAKILADWLTRQPTTAQAWVQQHPLSPPVAAELAKLQATDGN